MRRVERSNIAETVSTSPAFVKRRAGGIWKTTQERMFRKKKPDTSRLNTLPKPLLTLGLPSQMYRIKGVTVAPIIRRMIPASSMMHSLLEVERFVFPLSIAQSEKRGMVQMTYFLLVSHLPEGSLPLSLLNEQIFGAFIDRAEKMLAKDEKMTYTQVIPLYAPQKPLHSS
jgi:hypothetical protein